MGHDQEPSLALVKDPREMKQGDETRIRRPPANSRWRTEGNPDCEGEDARREKISRSE